MSKPSRRTRRNQKPDNQNEAQTYRHRQTGWTMLALFAIPIALCLASSQFHPQQQNSLLGVAGALTLLAWQFAWLWTEVDQTRLRVIFGPGLIRKQVLLVDIVKAEVTTSRFMEGWGIHYTRRGWLYNVSGRDCVLITQRDGKSFLVGSNDAMGLWEALQQHIEPEEPQPAQG
ncbi:MAG: hypothetical protein CGU29_02215 [Candidatus Dactylopiibacterium carminicum]|uniref:Bacterial Pleckstrin homology domain-containing protein n=1 Tax=Candidatus Dactylopiibacterium carminicum TaxID=857335 RepID=A0A272EXU9_9RHOO|nr:hypothetical protein [Candidatus Dactylopiibacterium carminicum]KAF7600484.1 hypothetical protein BGI27_01945 [Candidatus Dactylopiibacterium carminicum]PAS94947.1 MAG: hypothetical protein CGU29_02215 [Candidatus Dactylopiibacterium carminicum]PAT00489.1 MAG: hypothetical protein BSR46_01955 [Candidatus Dactylopiibacterium carminicum]